MNVIEPERALPQLRFGGTAAVLENRLRQAQAEPMDPIDLISCLVSDELAHAAVNRIDQLRKWATSSQNARAVAALASVVVYRSHSNPIRPKRDLSPNRQICRRDLSSRCDPTGLGDSRRFVDARSLQTEMHLPRWRGNGKTAFLNLAANFVGTENVCHLSLQRLESDRFSAARLYGKLANICRDLPSDRLSSSAMFKALLVATVSLPRSNTATLWSSHPLRAFYFRLISYSPVTMPLKHFLTDGS
jgi:hypothetical protein